MHVVENTIPNHLRMLRTIHRTSTVTCAIFYWICQIMKVKGVQETSLCQHCSVPLLAFKSVMTALDKKCDVVASRIKSQLQKMNSSEASISSTRPSTLPTASQAEFEQGDPTPRHKQIFTITILNSSRSPSPGPTTLRCTRSHPSGLAEESVSIEVDGQRAGLTVHIHL